MDGDIISSFVRSEVHALLYSTVGKNELTASLRSCGQRQDSARATSQVTCSQKLVYLALMAKSLCVCVFLCLYVCVKVVLITEALHKAVSIACTHHCDT